MFWRALLWFLFFIGATFAWVVVIEHGPENFLQGSVIEAENAKAIVMKILHLNS
ncbi:MAG: hypothetical protein JO308_05805 [Verrucomicrobia bacterium]|jgi:hypothetical protein|nr:hypothetical protein [Verrucomicrobiota bacterium]